MAIGYIKKKIVEGVETLVPETTAGPSAGTVRKLSFDCNIDYAVPITADETGEGYIGVSGNCKLSFNPKYNIGTSADPEYIGVLKADCFCGKGTDSEFADCVGISEVCQNLNYKVPFTCNCEVLTACSQNLLYNPNTGALTTNCLCASNEIEAMCEIRASEFKSRTTGVGVTVATTAEDDTLNHDGDVIYKGCNGELAVSSCKDFKFNPSNGTLTVDHVCSCDISNEIRDSKTCGNICYCSSATAHDYGVVSMHSFCCDTTSANIREGNACLGWEGFHVDCVPICQLDGSGYNYTCAIIGNGCDIWETQCCTTGCTRTYRCGSCAGLCEGVRVSDSNGCFCCGVWTNSTVSDGLVMRNVRKTTNGWRCPSVRLKTDASSSYVSLANTLTDPTYDNTICYAEMRIFEGNISGFVGCSQGDLGYFKLDSDGIFKVSNACTNHYEGRVLTDCDNICTLKNKDTTDTCLRFEGGNQFNTYGSTDLWINYAGGACCGVCIGNGSNSLGLLKAGGLTLEGGCMQIYKDNDADPSIFVGKWGISADTLHGYFAGYSTTSGAGYAGGIYLGKLNDLVDGRWGQVQIGYYDAEHANTRYCPRIGFYRADCGICMYDSVKIASGKVLCTQTICFY